VTDPAEAVRRSVRELRDDVDLIVLLTHQGKTAPMQTDAELDPRLQRDIDADYRLAGAVEGIDVLFAGHADAGTPEPVVHEKTGTLIMQTYGQATHLGYLQITLDAKTGDSLHQGKLIPVDSARLPPDPAVRAKLAKYRRLHPELEEKVGRTEARMNRRYIEESDVGNLFADIFVEASSADVGFVHSGSLRKDLPGGDVALVDILDTYPFVDEPGDQMTGARSGGARAVTALERGLLQVGARDRLHLSGPMDACSRCGDEGKTSDLRRAHVTVSAFSPKGRLSARSRGEARTLGKVRCRGRYFRSRGGDPTEGGGHGIGKRTA
jgi:2',3'-cyclic-nucleotide 2'-phosphodiesterase (5'-nucleotidase family)